MAEIWPGRALGGRDTYNDFLVRLALLVVVPAVVNELHLFEYSGLQCVCARDVSRKIHGATAEEVVLTLPDSPAPRSNILISCRALALSCLSCDSISSLPGAGGQVFVSKTSECRGVSVV